MNRSESVANKRDGRGWQDHWEKCSTTVRLEPPHAPLARHSIQSGEEIFRADLMVVVYCRMRRDEHNGEDWFCGKKRVETVWSGSATVISRNGQKADFV